jgi:hypothetical protein
VIGFETPGGSVRGAFQARPARGERETFLEETYTFQPFLLTEVRAFRPLNRLYLMMSPGTGTGRAVVYYLLPYRAHKRGNRVIRKRQSGALYGAGVFLAMGVAFAGGAVLKKSGAAPAKPIAPVRVAEATEGVSSVHLTAPAGEASENLATFEEVYRRVENEYTDALPSDTKLSQGAVSAMVASLEDPHSYFLNPAQRQLIDSEGKGKFSGIGAGLYLRAEDRGVHRLQDSCRRSPARLARGEGGAEIRRCDHPYRREVGAGLQPAGAVHQGGGALAEQGRHRR